MYANMYYSGSKLGLKLHMIIPLGMFYIMLHSPTIDAPVAGRSILYRLGHQIRILPHIHKDHLEP